MSEPSASQDAAVPQEAYRVLARKYRPSSFETLIGQEPMVRTLANAFRTNRIAQAYMLTGVRGVGKTTTARILARALNYETDAVREPSLDLGEPGVHCQAIMEGNHVDVIEMDAASHTGINDIREIIASVRYMPVSARYKVYIIDEVHMLSMAAFNGLLKTLEEPPTHVKFIFATTEIRKVPVTVLSRCQRFDLRRVDAGEMTEHLKGIAEREAVAVDDEALAIIARASEGSVRDSLSLLDQAIAHSIGSGDDGVKGESVRAMLGLADRSRVIDLFQHLMKGDVAAALEELKGQYDVGADPAIVLTDLADFVHFVTRLRYVPSAIDDASLSPVEREKGQEFAEKLSPRVLGRTWQMLLKGIAEVQGSQRPLPAADMVLVRIAHAADLPTPEEALKALSDAPSNAPSGGQTSSPPPRGAGSGSNAGSAPRGKIAQMPQRRPEPEPEISSQARAEATPAFPVVASFEELLALAEEKRDIRFKMLLRNNVSLVHFERGRIELKPVGDAPRELMNTISARLKDWTGENWMVVVSDADGAATIREREEAEQQSLVSDAEQDPLVAEVLRLFPKSRIIDVKVHASTDGLSEADAAGALVDPDADPDAESDAEDPGASDLDDYFQS